MKTTTSPRQIAANRCNALRSTGPKTSAGKAVSRLNALKHGILARQFVVRGFKFRESPREFEKLRREYHEHLLPVGPVEEMLVDKIVTADWRLRRVRQAETGAIAASANSACDVQERQPSWRGLFLAAALDPYNTEVAESLSRSSDGITYLMFCLEDVRQAVRRDGELTETALAKFNDNLCRANNYMTRKLEECRAWLLANPENLEPKQLSSRHAENVLNYLDREIETLDFKKDRCKEREAAVREAGQAAALVPSAEVLDRIMRYEKALERQLFRAMHQLERLQRRRQGEHVPPPAAIEVSTGS